MEHVSKSKVLLIHQVIPIINKLDDLLTSLSLNASIHATVCYAAKAALCTLRKYYAKTDECIMYQIAMSEFLIVHTSGTMTDRTLVLHPSYKTKYFKLRNWPDEWIDETVDIARNTWLSDYCPTPVIVTNNDTVQAALATPGSVSALI
jgi:hypothetical protein